MSKGITAVATVAVFLVAGCEQSNLVSPSGLPPVLANVPADGNGNKQVFRISSNFKVTCPSGEVLNRNAEGWVQVRTFDQAGNPNVELDVFHIVITFTNSDGETFVFRDVGPDRYYVDEDGNLILALTGRSTGSNVIGHVVINLTTGEVELVAGQEFGSARQLACEALT